MVRLAYHFRWMCNLSRPVDLHVRAMQSLGAVVELADGYIQARARGLDGGRIIFPLVSVGGTENLMAAVLAKVSQKLLMRRVNLKLLT